MHLVSFGLLVLITDVGRSFSTRAVKNLIRIRPNVQKVENVATWPINRAAFGHRLGGMVRMMQHCKTRHCFSAGFLLPGRRQQRANSVESVDSFDIRIIRDVLQTCGFVEWVR